MTDRPAAERHAPSREEAGAAAAPELVPAEQVTAALEAAAEFKDRLLRTLAEMENLRKRTEREVAEARLYGITSFARDVLAVADNMHRALATIDEELRRMPTPNCGADRGRRADRARIDESSGKARCEQILARSARNSIPTCTRRCTKFPIPMYRPAHVAQVIQSGYMFGERVLRPAMVAVAKAAAKSPARSANDNPLSIEPTFKSAQRDAVAHGAEAREQRVPVGFGTTTPMMRIKPPAAKAHPLHQLTGRRVGPFGVALISYRGRPSMRMASADVTDSSCNGAVDSKSRANLRAIVRACPARPVRTRRA